MEIIRYKINDTPMTLEIEPIILPTGVIAMSDVNVELNRPWNQAISLGDPEVRRLAGIPSGPISLGDLRGKTNTQQINMVGWRDSNQNMQVDVSGSSSLTNVFAYFYTGPDYGYNEVGYRVTGGRMPARAYLRVVYYTIRDGVQTREFNLGAGSDWQKGARFGAPYPQGNSNIEFYLTLYY